VRVCALHGDAERLARILHRQSDIDSRGCVFLGDESEPLLAPVAPGGQAAPTTEYRMALYERLAPPLAAEAARRAISAAGVSVAHITHLVTVSCTGFAAPGVDLALVKQLEMAPTTRRVNVGFMGCHGAINAIEVAQGLARMDACVLVVCVELCTLHFQRTSRPDQIVANALFGDGAAACVVGSGNHGPRIKETASCVLPDSGQAMRWLIGDCGFQMTLDQSVPGIIREHLQAWLRGAAAAAFDRPMYLDAIHWCVHPGGPKVLSAVQQALGLPPAALQTSRDVLRRHGNMSSATVLFILQELIQSRSCGPAAMLAFGPGLSAEACWLDL
jgi:predicted naringenin-chalcone synthase